ncbi:TetR/AcrR family transcriptional regulator [Mycobacterium sp. E2479]|uniref:TetR/AcrR family transcriptional regulator n=1 Tax=Mycobacterium sp. E2479 TaxID=1834134 RepID=UPI003512E415
MSEDPRERPYGGVDAGRRVADRRARLLSAGLDVLGTEQRGTAALTVRTVCRQAGLTPRYFYESFADKDEFVASVFDWVVAELAATTQAAVAAAPAAEQARACMADIVRSITEDPRVGRLLFSTQLADPVIVRKRVESSALFAMLSGQHVGQALQVPANERIKAAAHFVVGGVGQTISAWLAGDVQLEPDQLIDQLAALLDELAEPKLYRLFETRADT